jgi:hypothetical protein
MVLILLVACMAATILKYAIFVLAIALAITVLWGCFTAPLETIGLLVFYAFARALADHTVATLAFLGVAGLCLAITGGTAEKPGSSADQEIN